MALTIAQRIALEGSTEIKRELEALGVAGELAFKKLQQAADKVKGPPDAFSRALQNAERQLRNLSTNFDRIGRNLQQVGRRFTTFLTAPIVAGFGLAVRAAANFESAMADVRKVVDFPTPQAFARLEDDLRRLSETIPLTATELATIAAAAGQAGVAAEDLAEFTELVAQSAIAFGLSAEEAGRQLAVIKTALGLSTPQVRLLSDAMNQLANNMAASEDQILHVVTIVGALGETVGVSATDIAALGAAMTATSGDADRSATALRNVIQALTAGENATAGAKEGLRALGLEAVDVARRLQEEGVAVLVDVFERIRRLPGELQASTIQQIFGLRAVSSVAPLVKQIDVLADALGLVAEEADFAGSTLREFNIRSETALTTFQLFGNAVDNLASAIGEQLLPPVTRVTEALTNLINNLSRADGETLGVGVRIAGLAAAIGPALIALGLLARGIAFVAGGLALLFTSPGIAVFVAALAVAGVALGKIIERQVTAAAVAADHRESINNLEQAFRDVVEGVEGAEAAFDSLAKRELAEAQAAVIAARAAVEAARIRAGALVDNAGPAGAIARLRAGFGGANEELEQAQQNLREIENRLLAIAAVRGDPEALSTLRERMAANSELAERLSFALGEVGASGERAGQQVAEGMGEAGEAIGDAADRADRIITVFRDGVPVRFGVFDGIVRALDDVSDGAEDAGAAVGHASGELIDFQAELQRLGRVQADDPTEPMREGVRETERAAGEAFAEIERRGEQAGVAIGGALGRVADGAEADFERVAASVERLADTLQQATTLTAPQESEGPAISGSGQFRFIVESAEQARDQVAELFNQLSDVIVSALFDSVAAWDQLPLAAVNASNNIVAAFEGLGERLGTAFRAIVGAVRAQFLALERSIASVIARLVRELSRLQAAIAGARAEAAAAGSEGGGGGFAAGGGVFGPAGTDVIPAWLTSGEWVQPVPAVRYYGAPFMQAIRSLRFPRALAQAFSVGDVTARLQHSFAPASRFAFQAGGAVPAVSPVDGVAPRTVRLEFRIGDIAFPPIVTDESIAAGWARAANRAADLSAGRGQDFFGRK